MIRVENEKELQLQLGNRNCDSTESAISQSLLNLHMCVLCGSETPRKTSLQGPHKKNLGLIGGLRRRLIHGNYKDGKEHTLSEDVIRSEWNHIEALKQKGEKRLKKDLENMFEEQIGLLLRNLIKKVGIKALKKARKKPEITPFIVNTLINWSHWFRKTGERAKGGVTAIVKDGFEAAFNRIGAQSGSFSSRQKPVPRVIGEILEKTKNTQATFRKSAIQSIQRGLSKGDTMTQLVGRVAENTSEQVGYRLDRIVRTAGNGGFEFGEKLAFKKSGIERIKWMSERDPRVRTPLEGDLWDHRSADGQEIGIDENFILTGKGTRREVLRFPSDPQGSPGNTIYCRCSIMPATQFEQPAYPPSGV